MLLEKMRIIQAKFDAGCQVTDVDDSAAATKE